MNIKQNKGISSADAIIAIVILMIFTGIIATISTNIYAQSQYIKRNDQATNLIVEVFEYAQGITYDNVSSSQLATYINALYDNVNAIEGNYNSEGITSAGYRMFINVEETQPGYVKQINITVAYKVKGKIYSINMKTLINK